MNDAYLVRRLEIIGNKIYVPGCEPTSSVTSITLMAAQRAVCKNSMVNVRDVLAAIPGSYIEYGLNWGNTRQRWLVLPPLDLACCVESIDYYKIIRNLGTVEAQEESKFDICNTLGMGYCPSPDFAYDKQKHTQDNAYVLEGTPLYTTITP